MRYKPTTGAQTADARQLSFELTSGTELAPQRWDFSTPEVVAEVDEAATGQLAKRNVAPATESDTTNLSQRIYPHMYEAEAQTGVAMSLVGRAKTEAASAVDAYLLGDIQEVSSRLALVATSAAAAHRNTRFNEAFGAVVSFIRRAALAANVAEIELPQLMQLSKALNTLHAEPMLTLDAATDVVESLEQVGWRGQHAAVAELVAALIGDSPSPAPVSAPERTA